VEQSKYLSHDTIHALATPVGGALAVVRMSGPGAIKALERLHGQGGSSARAEFSTRVPREMFRVKLQAETPAGNETLDDAMAVFFQAPKSQTGEDLVEFFLHGGPIVAARVLRALEDLGSRQALAGEFSFRAVRNGKTSITAAQAVAELIAATNDGAAKLALEKMEGSQARLITELAERLRKLSTMGELGIDFADQDVEELSLPVLKLHVKEILARLEHLGNSFDRGEKIQSGVRVAFVGRPNAGKSSFFNVLLGEDRSIVSEIAGTTRDVVRERLTLRADGATVTLRLEDTAGIRDDSDDTIERQGIERSVRAAADADFVILICDATGTDAEWDETRAVWSAIGEPREKSLVVLTKRDRASEADFLRARNALGSLRIPPIGIVSSTTGEGVSEAAKGIVGYCSKFIARAPGEVLLTRLDHLRAVRDTVTHLERALATTEEDLFAADLRQALTSLGPVIGETLPDDILGRIFSEFCIGK
jgi:tRNA modification GTPase